MSYNCDKFSVKKLELQLPVGFDMKTISNNDWVGGIEVASDMKTWTYNEDGEGFSMSGIVEGDKFVVKELNCTGEGSGHDFNDIVKPLFEKFKGNLIANTVWEGGDTIETVRFDNGVYSSEELDF